MINPEKQFTKELNTSNLPSEVGDYIKDLEKKLESIQPRKEDLLSRGLDKLTNQEIDELTKLNIEATGILNLIKESRDKRKIADESITDLESEPQIIRAMSPEGKEIILDFEQIKSQWILHWEKYGIEPKGIEELKLDSKRIQKAKELIEKYGFNMIMIEPEGISASDLIKNEKFINYPDSDRREPVWTRGDIVQTRYLDSARYTPRITMIKEKPGLDTKEDHTADTAGKTYPEILKIQESLDLDGIDSIQFLTYHRYYYDKYHKHPHVGDKGQEVLLIPTIGRVRSLYSSSSGTIRGNFCMNAFWSAESAKLFINVCRDNMSEKKIGAIFCKKL